MKKPTIFFSHSSKDEKYLSEIKNKLLKNTSSTINIFQSSDGESIPFGNNWVHKIEENLNNSKLMFVFISPNSIKSNWIYFEAGFSYSKGIKVIPIGINGIDIGQLAPPINLLQGFNITSENGLNNIIAIINREFSISFPESFEAKDFQDISMYSSNVLISNNYTKYIDFFEIKFSNEYKNLNSNAFENIENYLKGEKIKHSKNGDYEIYIPGMFISNTQNNSSNKLIIKFDYLNLSNNIELIIKLLSQIYLDVVPQYYFRIRFTNKIDFITTNFKISSRLNNYGIKISELNGKLYNFKTVLFAIDEIHNKKSLRIVFNPKEFELNNIFELIKILFEQEIASLK
jgi:hypothetical protein